MALLTVFAMSVIWAVPMLILDHLYNGISRKLEEQAELLNSIADSLNGILNVVQETKDRQ